MPDSGPDSGPDLDLMRCMFKIFEVPRKHSIVVIKKAPRKYAHSFDSDDNQKAGMLELRMQEAIRRSGKSLEYWISDILSEKEHMRADNRKQDYRQAEMPDDRFHDSYGTPYDGQVYGDLVDRVRLLEQSLRAEHAASLSETSRPSNYDEDARALIEGLRARQNFTNRDEQISDRLMEMLNKISDLENKLEDMSSITMQKPDSANHDEKNEQLMRLEDQLQKLEEQLQDHHQKRADHSASHKKSLTARKAGNAPKGRDAFQKAMQNIAKNEEDSLSHKDSPSSTMIGRSHAERRAIERQFSILMHKMDDLAEKSSNRDVLESLQEELAELRMYVSRQDMAPQLERLQESLSKIKENGSREALGVLETDLNRIAEFLLKSPDLTQLPDQATAIIREINRLSDGLLATSQQNNSALNENRQEIVKDLEASLTGLRNDIIANLNGHENTDDASGNGLNASLFEKRLLALGEHIDGIGQHISKRINDVDNQLGTVQNQLGDNFDSRLSKQVEGLRKQIGSVLENVSGKVDGVEKQLTRASEKLEALGNIRYGSLESTQELAAMEGRLVKAAERLEKASLDAAGTQASGVLLAHDAINRNELKDELNVLASRLGTQFDAMAKEKTVDKSSLLQLTKEFSAFESRLERSLDARFENLAKSSSQTQQTNFDQIDLKEQVEILSSEFNASLLSEKDNMVNHIDQAMSQIQKLLKEQHETLKTIASRADSLQMGSPFYIEDEVQESSLEIEKKDFHITAESLDELEENLSPEEMMLKRMREHVKARKPDDALIEPGEDDRPLAPGAGKPDLTDAELQSVDDEYGELSLSVEAIIETRDDINDEYDERDDDLIDQKASEPSSQRSKTDFIAAARRAAQAAASEQASLNASTPDTAQKSTLTAFREKLNMVSKIRRNAKDDGVKEDGLEEFSSTGTSYKEAQSYSHNADTEQKTISDDLENSVHLNEEEIIHSLSDEDTTSSNRTKVLTFALVIAVFGAGYLLLREPVSNLFYGLSNGLNEEPITLKNAPVDVPLPEKPVQEIPTLQDERGGGQFGVPEKNKPLEETIEAVPEVQTNLSPLGKTPQKDVVTLAQNAFGIDNKTITQAIQPDTVHDRAGEQVLSNPLIKKQLATVPPETLSPKLKTALLKDDPAAYLEMARRYSVGDLVASDLKKAAFWYEQAALKEHAVAQFRLGTLFEEGIGIAKNPEKAKEWYLKAAQNGNARAMHNLAVLNTEGAFGSPDFSKAFKWFERAANYGVKDSQFNLGILYVRGLGTPVSLTQAYKWFDIVAKGGDVDAAEKRDDIAKALNDEQLKNAQNESQIWVKNKWIESANVIAVKADYWRDGKEQVHNNTNPETKNQLTSSNLVKETQLQLNGLGFDAGKADGIIGEQTKKAVRSFEYELGLPQTGKISKKLLEILKAQKI